MPHGYLANYSPGHLATLLQLVTQPPLLAHRIIYKKIRNNNSSIGGQNKKKNDLVESLTSVNFAIFIFISLSFILYSFRR